MEGPKRNAAAIIISKIKKNDNHRMVFGVCYKKDRSENHSDHKCNSSCYLVGTLGGQVEDHERSYAAMKREFNEETGGETLDWVYKNNYIKLQLKD